MKQTNCSAGIVETCALTSSMKPEFQFITLLLFFRQSSYLLCFQLMFKHLVHFNEWLTLWTTIFKLVFALCCKNLREVTFAVFFRFGINKTAFRQHKSNTVGFSWPSAALINSSSFCFYLYIHRDDDLWWKWNSIFALKHKLAATFAIYIISKSELRSNFMYCFWNKSWKIFDYGMRFGIAITAPLALPDQSDWNGTNFMLFS